MADIITRLKVDTKNHDQGLRQATQSIKQFEQQNMSLDGVLKTGIQSLSKYVTVAAAVAGAMKVASDAFKRNESDVDEWGRVVESAKSVYGGFVSALNGGDFGGFISNIDNIVSAARAAYNALDELQTKATIIAPQQAKIQAQMTAQREIIRRQGKDSQAGQQAQQELKRLEQDMKSAYKETAKLNRNAFITAVKQRAQEGGITLTNEMWRSFTDTKAYDAISKRAKGSVSSTNVTSGTVGATYSINTDTRNAERKFLDVFTDEFRKSVSGYLTAEWGAHAAAHQTGVQNARYIGATGGGGRGSSRASSGVSAASGAISGVSIKEMAQIGSINYYDALIGGLRTQLANTGDIGVAKAIQADINRLEGLKATLEFEINEDQIREGIGENIKNTLEDMMADVEFLPLDTGNVVKGAKDSAKSWQLAAQSINSASSALQQMDNKGMNIAGTIMQAVASIMLGFASASANEGKTGNVWEWIAATVAGLATAVATVVTIKKQAAGSFAEGGVVPGNYNGGVDSTYIYASPGELILNRAQQQSIAGQLSGGGGAARTTINGEQLVTVINAYGRRTGRGEILR